MSDKKTASFTNLNLSEALLAPLNAIFEAQVHASRSFLSFVLQMGFRQKHSESEIHRLKSNPVKNSEILKKVEMEVEDRKEINRLKIKQKDVGLSDEEHSNLITLVNRWDDIYSQDFNFVDDQGNEHVMSIPNLALIPVKPLAIDTANFKFDMYLNSTYENFETEKGTADTDAEHRPWMLIKPKRLTGTIAPRTSNNNGSSISIEINVKSTEMPYGLSKLLTMMTENSRIYPKDTRNDK